MWEREIEEMKNAALLAEKKILEVYHSTFKVETKSDDSPVTEADKAADKAVADDDIQQDTESKFDFHL